MSYTINSYYIVFLEVEKWPSQKGGKGVFLGTLNFVQVLLQIFIFIVNCNIL